MELLEFIAQLAKPQITSELERYWRLIVNCFLVDRLQQLELGGLLTKFEQYYGRMSYYNDELPGLLQEPEFKTICLTVQRGSTLFLQPSEFLLRVLCARIDSSDPKELIAPNNNNTNVLARDEQKEINQNDANETYETRFGTMMLEELNCAVCFELVKEAVEGECCKNVFCRQCIEQNGRRCPNCRREVGWKPNEPIQRMIRKNPIKCDYDGCKAWSTPNEIEQHRVRCEFNPENLVITCQKCQQRIKRRLLEEHLSDTCEMVKVPCPICSSMIVRKDLSDHEEQYCELRMVSCDHGCGGYMPYCDYISSHFNRCSHQPIKCTNSNQQCPVIVRRRHLDAHLGECQYSRLACIYSTRGCDVKHAKNEEAAWHKHITECHFMIVKCPHGCGAEMFKYRVPEHVCFQMPLDCPHCNDAFKMIDWTNHVKECPSRMRRWRPPLAPSIQKKPKFDSIDDLLKEMAQLE